MLLFPSPLPFSFHPSSLGAFGWCCLVCSFWWCCVPLPALSGAASPSRLVEFLSLFCLCLFSSIIIIVMGHQITHLPFRSWCLHCTRRPSSKNGRTSGAKRIATVNIDLFFMGSQGLSFTDPSTEQDTLPTLGVNDHQTRVTFAHVQAPGRGGARHPGPRRRLRVAWESEIVAQKTTRNPPSWH